MYLIILCSQMAKVVCNITIITSNSAVWGQWGPSRACVQVGLALYHVINVNTCTWDCVCNITIITSNSAVWGQWGPSRACVQVGLALYHVINVNTCTWDCRSSTFLMILIFWTVFPELKLNLQCFHFVCLIHE